MSGNHDRDDPGSAGHDASVAGAWREASDEQPPLRLDAAILAAARESAQQADPGAKPRLATPRPRSWWLQWQPLLAAATVAGLALVLVLQPRDREVAPAIYMGEQASVAGPSSDEQRAATIPPAAEATAGAARQPALERAPVIRGETDGRALPATAAPRSEETLRDAGSPSAGDRAARIAALYASGDETGAAVALREFRAAEPGADSYLPESLREWARTVE